MPESHPAKARFPALMAARDARAPDTPSEILLLSPSNYLILQRLG
jgi:hypothetical protein